MKIITSALILLLASSHCYAGLYRSEAGSDPGSGMVISIALLMPVINFLIPVTEPTNENNKINLATDSEFVIDLTLQSDIDDPLFESTDELIERVLGQINQNPETHHSLIDQNISFVSTEDFIWLKKLLKDLKKQESSFE